MKKFFGLLLVLITVTACTSKDAYEIGQDYQKNECINNAQTDEQLSQCLSAERKSYEAYEKEREAVINH